MSVMDDAREALAQAALKFPDEPALRHRAAARALLRALDDVTPWAQIAGKGRSLRDALDGVEAAQSMPLALALVEALDKSGR